MPPFHQIIVVVLFQFAIRIKGVAECLLTPQTLKLVS